MKLSLFAFLCNIFMLRRKLKELYESNGLGKWDSVYLNPKSIGVASGIEMSVVWSDMDTVGLYK